MKDVVVFCGRNALDFPVTRQSVLRIPEVSLRLRQAQDYIDQFGHTNFDMQFFVGSDDSLFMRNIKWKSLASAIVQIGLYDRWLKRFSEPAFFIGASNADSAIQVCARQMEFKQLIENNFPMQQKDAIAIVSSPLPSAQSTVLAGIALEQFEGYQLITDPKSAHYQRMDQETHDFNALLFRMIEEHELQRLILIGPGNNVLNTMVLRSQYDQVQVMDSIEVDPMLTWFWSDIRSVGAAVGFQ